MKAVVLEKTYCIKIIEEDIPSINENEALIKIEYAGICGSDVNSFKGDNKLITYPRIIGHEVVGTIVNIKNKTSNLNIGDTVILKPYHSCGKCYACLNIKPNACETLELIGVHVDGAMREYINYDVEKLIKVNNNNNIKKFSLVEPLSVALHTINQSNIEKDEYIIVFGCGTIGILTCLVARYKGAIPILIGTREERLELAKKLDIEHVLFFNDKLLDNIKDITNNVLPPVVIEASGSNEAIKKCFECVSYTGQVTLTGWPKSETLLSTDIITKKELTVKGSRNSNNELYEALYLIENDLIDVEKLISNTISIHEVPKYLKLLEEKKDYLKIVVNIGSQEI